MNLPRSIEMTLAQVVIGVIKTPTVIGRLLVFLGRRIRSAWRALVSPHRKNSGGPDDGAQGAGVPARLKPPPPVLAAAAAKALPEFGEFETA